MLDWIRLSFDRFKTSNPPLNLIIIDFIKLKLILFNNSIQFIKIELNCIGLWIESDLLTPIEQTNDNHGLFRITYIFLPRLASTFGNCNDFTLAL